jgi:WD40 repeat protein
MEKRIASWGVTDIKLWDAETGAVLKTLSGHKGGVSAAFSPDGKRIVSGGDNTIKLWDATTGAELKTLSREAGSVVTVTFSHDGKRIVSGTVDGKIDLWDVMTGAKLKTMLTRAGPDPVNLVAISPDGKWVAAVNSVRTENLTTGKTYSDNTIKLWDAVTGAKLNTMSGHTMGLYDVAFSPDGKTIASGSSDGTIKTVGRCNGKGDSIDRP